MTDDDLVRHMMQVTPGMPHAYWIRILEKMHALPLWRHIFCDRLGQVGQ
jgi:hypothetical protein